VVGYTPWFLTPSPRLKLLPKLWQRDEDGPMNFNTFPQKTYSQTKKSAKLSVSEGLAQLRRLADGTGLKAYIEDHEEWMLILLVILLIAGTVFYVDFQPPS
jgi:hypothetical protein